MIRGHSGVVNVGFVACGLGFVRHLHHFFVISTVDIMLQVASGCVLDFHRCVIGSASLG